MSRHPPARQVSHAVPAHRRNRSVLRVDHEQPEPGDLQCPLQNVESRPPGALCPSDRGGTDADGLRQLALAEIGTPSSPSQRAGHIEAAGHATTLGGPSAEWQ
jgi:hypothetical protein